MHVLMKMCVTQQQVPSGRDVGNMTVPKGVHENRTVGVENNVAGRLKLNVFLKCAQRLERFHKSKR